MTKIKTIDEVFQLIEDWKWNEAKDAIKEVYTALEQSSNSDYATCEGCKYLHGKCILNAPNNCIRDADDYYTIA